MSDDEVRSAVAEQVVQSAETIAQLRDRLAERDLEIADLRSRLAEIRSLVGCRP